MKAKKSFGQHFLINEPLAEAIANGLLKEEGIKNVLEVGPGKGVLTKYLVRQDINLRVVEADRDMVSYIEKQFPSLVDDIIFLDFLKLHMGKVFDGEPFYLIGNFPYNISSQIIFKMLSHKELIPEMVGMFQKELADRVISGPGSKVYGVISVLTQAYYEGSTIHKVSPGSFSPPPKVQSSVIRLKRKPEGELGVDYKALRSVVKTSFSQRRKMLRNTLKSLVKDTSILQEEQFQRRPEQLGLEEFVNIAKRIEYVNKNTKTDESGKENND